MINHFFSPSLQATLVVALLLSLGVAIRRVSGFMIYKGQLTTLGGTCAEERHRLTVMENAERFTIQSALGDTFEAVLFQQQR